MKKQITKGLKIDNPDIFIPWGINGGKLERLFTGYPLKFIIKGYYTCPVTLFESLSCILGLHLDYGVLNYLEFFREQTDLLSRSISDSYNDFQRNFENIFGKPHDSHMGYEGYETHIWVFNNVTISHSVYERFVISEYMSIRKK